MQKTSLAVKFRLRDVSDREEFNHALAKGDVKEDTTVFLTSQVVIDSLINNRNVTFDDLSATLAAYEVLTLSSKKKFHQWSGEIAKEWKRLVTLSEAAAAVSDEHTKKEPKGGKH